MIRSELVARVAAQNPHLYAKDVERVVAAILDRMADALADGDRVELRDFGTFATKERRARARLPRKTGRPGRGAILLPELDSLADRDRQLLPSHRDPERFHVERGAIVRALRRLVRSASSHL